MSHQAKHHILHTDLLHQAIHSITHPEKLKIVRSRSNGPYFNAYFDFYKRKTENMFLKSRWSDLDSTVSDVSNFVDV